MISPSTICYALKKTYDFLRSEYLCEKTECNRKRLEEFSDAVEEIDSLKFEIEGYERVQWTKFDPKDPKTFPMRNENVLLYVELDDGGRQMMNARTFIMNKCHFLDLKGKLISEEKMDAITHWRPLPPPPGKEEAQ